jgi:hypothetical protein
MLRTSAIAVILVLVLSAAAFTGENPDCKVAIHVQPHDPGQSCENLPTITSCADIQTTYPGLGEIDAFVVFYDLTSVMSYRGGMIWPNGWAWGTWRGCGDGEIIYEYHNSVYWDGYFLDCQYHNHLVIGWCWIEASSCGWIVPIPDENSGFLGVDDCGHELDEAKCVSAAGVGGMIGDDPCLPSAAESKTWSGIKSIFR